MPISLSEVTQETATTAITIDDDPEGLYVTYWKRAYSPEIERIIKAGTDNQTPAEAIARAFCRLVKSWTLPFGKDSDGPIPLTLEGLDPVPSELLSEIMRQIGEHRASQLPNTQTGNGSRPH